MPIPSFNDIGDLPLGVHAATVLEVAERFGAGIDRRTMLMQRLVTIYEIARGTGLLFRFVVFGSFVTEKPEPEDVDVFFLMENSFQPASLTDESRALFDHLQAQAHFGASVF